MNGQTHLIQHTNKFAQRINKLTKLIHFDVLISKMIQSITNFALFYFTLHFTIIHNLNIALIWRALLQKTCVQKSNQLRITLHCQTNLSRNFKCRIYFLLETLHGYCDYMTGSTWPGHMRSGLRFTDILCPALIGSLSNMHK